MSKFVKNLVTDHLRDRLRGVENALLVNVEGMNANANNALRQELASKNIHLLVVKASLAARATAGTELAPLFDSIGGPAAVCWGSEDIVALAKEVTRLGGDAKYQPFAPRRGVLDGEKLTAEQVVGVSKWPSREEQIRILVGQILSPAATLSGQMLGCGAALASQIEKAAGDEAQTAEAPEG